MSFMTGTQLLLPPFNNLPKKTSRAVRDMKDGLPVGPSMTASLMLKGLGRSSPDGS